MIILHGENTTKSREQLYLYITAAKNEQTEIRRIEAKNCTEAFLEESLGSTDLFETPKLTIIEELHSLPVSKKRAYLISLLAQNTDQNIILWEKRSLTKTMLKPFSNATVVEYKMSKTLFSWLELLGNTQNQTKKLLLLKDAIATDGDFFCFLMLIRQIRMLIQVKSGETVAGPPFVVAKLRKQSELFTLEKLLQTHAQLLKIDSENKTSKNILTLPQQLDLLSLNL